MLVSRIVEALAVQLVWRELHAHRRGERLRESQQRDVPLTAAPGAIQRRQHRPSGMKNTAAHTADAAILT
jgi:hypothetical protein